MGVGAAVLGVPAAAYAAEISQAGAVFYQVPGLISQVGLVETAKTPPLFTTNDTVWT
jgi:hypothetical protein